MPVPFTTISVSDGVSMNHKGMRMSLVSREIIADSIEAVMRAHAYDALVGFAGCDKTLPGMMMAMVRLNCPSVFVYGGAMLPGRWRGRDVTVLTAYEGVGAVLAGAMTDADLADLGTGVCADASAPAPASSPPTPWRWWPRRWALRCRARRCFLPSIPSASRWLGTPAGAPTEILRKRRPAAARSRHPQIAGECRAAAWRLPAARPMRACICRPSPTRPVCASR